MPVVILPQEGKNGTRKAPKVFFSSDLKMDGAQVLRIYNARFQCEFPAYLHGQVFGSIGNRGSSINLIAQVGSNYGYFRIRRCQVQYPDKAK